MIKARFTYINKRQSDFAISQGFYFHETSHREVSRKIKSSGKFPNLQYALICCNDGSEQTVHSISSDFHSLEILNTIFICI